MAITQLEAHQNVRSFLRVTTLLTFMKNLYPPRQRPTQIALPEGMQGLARVRVLIARSAPMHCLTQLHALVKIIVVIAATLDITQIVEQLLPPAKRPVTPTRSVVSATMDTAALQTSTRIQHVAFVWLATTVMSWTILIALSVRLANTKAPKGKRSVQSVL